MTALEELAALDLEFKRQKHPSVPPKYMPKTKFEDKTANGLTRCVIRWFEVHNRYASRIASTGTYRANTGKFIISQQRPGIPDVHAVVYGLSIHVEVKVGKDRLSDAQRETMSALVANGAYVYVAHSFQGFSDWYKQYIAVIPSAEPTPYFEWHPIPHLATPDLPSLFNPTTSE